MNKTIEFVEKEILICNQNIDFQMQIAFESQENKFKKRYHENEALKLTEKLQMLHQIKAELEAWEVIKEKFFIDIIERDNDYKIGFEPKTPIINGTITRFAQLDKYKGTIIKKALEIENDK